MTEDNGKRTSAKREELWSKETAESWDISNRVLLIVALKGSFFDEENPRVPLFRKLENVIHSEELRILESKGLGARNPQELRSAAQEYNSEYRRMFLEVFDKSELRTIAVSSKCTLLPSRELEDSVRL